MGRKNREGKKRAQEKKRKGERERIKERIRNGTKERAKEFGWVEERTAESVSL